MPPSSGSIASASIPDIFILDEQKIQPSENTEKQELYVLQWLAQVERESKIIDGVYKAHASNKMKAKLTCNNKGNLEEITTYFRKKSISSHFTRYSKTS
jgi:hypothetical protein